MRISDWSSDVCSSDLPWAIPSIFPIIGKIRPFADAAIVGTISRKLASTETNDQSATGPPWPDILRSEERRVGKECVSRVDLGGRRIIKQKKKQQTKYQLQ